LPLAVYNSNCLTDENESLQIVVNAISPSMEFFMILAPLDKHSDIVRYLHDNQIICVNQQQMFMIKIFDCNIIKILICSHFLIGYM